MSEKIVQFNEEIIKGQIKELVRGSVEETLNELHACSKKFEFYCLTSRGLYPSLSLRASYFLKLSFRETLRLKTRCSGEESTLSRQK